MGEGQVPCGEGVLAIALENVHGRIMHSRLCGEDSALGVAVQGKVKTRGVRLIPEEEAFNDHLLAGCRGPHTTLWGGEVVVRDGAELVLAVCLCGDKHRGLSALSGAFTHGRVDLSQVSLCALRHSGGRGGVKIHRIECEGGIGRDADKSVRRSSNAERWCHGGRRKGREQRKHGDANVRTMVRDKKDCMTKVREGRKEEKARRQNNTLEVS